MAGKTLKELELLRQAEKDERERVRLSVKLKICPNCGIKLKRERAETLKEPQYYFFGLFLRTTYLWDYRMICTECGFEDKYDFSFSGIE